MKTLVCLILFLSGSLVQPADIQIVVPNSLDSAEGNTSGWPFTFQSSGVTSRRYQQVYDASEFTSMAPLGGYIKQLGFRADMVGHGGFAQDDLDSVQINLGITPRSPDGLSAIFSENVPPANMMVYGPAPLKIETHIGWALIPLAQPFLYVPAAGNLLIDIRTTDTTAFFPVPLYSLDAENTMGDSISSVFANDVNATSGFVRTIGLVTLFHIEPIPEPSTWALLGLGLLAMWRFLSRRSRS